MFTDMNVKAVGMLTFFFFLNGAKQAMTLNSTVLSHINFFDVRNISRGAWVAQCV